MARRLLLLFSVVALAVFLCGVSHAAIVYTDPAVLSIQDATIRMMQTSLTGSGTGKVNIDAPGLASGYAIVSNDPQVVLNSGASGTIVKGWTAVKSPSYAVTFTPSNYDLGSHSGTVTLSGVASPPVLAATVARSTATVTANVLQDRELVVGSLGSVGEPYRVVQKAIATKIANGSATNLTVGTGSDPTAADNQSTRVNTLAKGKMVTQVPNPYDPSGKPQTITVTYNGTPLTQFNDVGQTADLGVKFNKAGAFAGTIDLAATNSKGAPVLLSNGEAATVGASLKSALLSYNVAVLERRKLKGSASLNLLQNAPLTITNQPATFVVDTKNKNNLDFLTSVIVGKDSPTMPVTQKAPDKTIVTIGSAAITETRIEGSGTWDMRAAVGMNISLATPLAAGQTSLYGKLKYPMTVSVPVVTGEAASAGDVAKDGFSSAYKALKLSVAANVGNAALSKLTPTAFAPDTMVLSANISSGSELASTGAPLSSRVDPKSKMFVMPGDEKATGALSKNGLKLTSILNPDPLKRKTLTDSQAFGIVGSEAQIVKSTAVGSDTVVSMQWRARTPGESFQNGMSGKDATMPNGIDWLTSDVVKIGSNNGALDNTVYALRMSFDDRIALKLDGLEQGQLQNDWDRFFVAQLKDVGGQEQWTRAGTGEGYFPIGTPGATGSVEEFLAANSDKTIDELVGSWGVETSLSATGTGHSWVIVKGGGTFAVAPEPSTLVLLGTVGIGLIGYGVRRYRRRATV